MASDLPGFGEPSTVAWYDAVNVATPEAPISAATAPLAVYVVGHDTVKVPAPVGPTVPLLVYVAQLVRVWAATVIVPHAPSVITT